MPIFHDETTYVQVDPVLTVEDQANRDLGMYVAKVVIDVAVQRYGQGQRT